MTDTAQSAAVALEDATVAFRVVGNRVYVIDEGGQIAAFQSGDAAGG